MASYIQFSTDATRFIFISYGERLSFVCCSKIPTTHSSGSTQSLKEKMFNGSYTFHLLFLAVLSIALIHAQSTADKETGRNEKGDRKLSRKRRYLIFPTGSSIQLGNIFNSSISFIRNLIDLMRFLQFMMRRTPFPIIRCT